MDGFFFLWVSYFEASFVFLKKGQIQGKYESNPVVSLFPQMQKTIFIEDVWDSVNFFGNFIQFVILYVEIFYPVNRLFV